MLRQVAAVTIALMTVAAAILPTGAVAKDRGNFVTEFGKTRPPIGYVRFCAENPRECHSVTLLNPRLKLTPEHWNDLYRVNTKINTTIKPATDEELYGKAEHWTYPETAGDCEDYLLLKKRVLEAIGFPASSLLITVVMDENNQGHAVLSVAADSGDYILDNRRNDILTWRETSYRFLKRQTQRDPRQWVSLDGSGAVATAALATTSGE